MRHFAKYLQAIDVFVRTHVDEYFFFINRKFARKFSAEPQNLSEFLWLLSKTTTRQSFQFENYSNEIPAKNYMQLIFKYKNPTVTNKITNVNVRQAGKPYKTD